MRRPSDVSSSIRRRERRAVDRFLGEMIRPSVWDPILDHFEQIGRIDGNVLGDLVEEKAASCKVPAAHAIRGQLLILAIDGITLMRICGIPFNLICIPWLFVNHPGPYFMRAQLLRENLQN